MERDKEIVKILEKLDKSTNEGNEIYQQLFDFHKINAETSKKTYSAITGQLDLIVKEVQTVNKSKSQNILSSISTTLMDVPSLLSDVKKSIDVQTSVLDLIVKEIKNVSKTDNQGLLTTISKSLTDVPILLSDIKKSIDNQTSIFDSLFGKIYSKIDELSKKEIPEPKKDNKEPKKGNIVSENLLTTISKSLTDVPSLLSAIKKSIDVQTSILGSIIGSMSGQGDGISSLKGFEKQSSDSSFGKLDNMFKSANKTIDSPSEAKSKNKKTSTIGGFKPEDMKTITHSFKNMGELLKGFIGALKEYAKIQDRIDAEGLVNNVVNIVTKISDILLHKKLPKKDINKTLVLIAKGLVKFIEEIADIKKSKVNKFIKLTEAISGGFGKIVDLLDKITQNPDRYDTAIEVFKSIVKAIKSMQISFILAALIFPFIPFAMVSFWSMFKVANMVGWFGLFGIRKMLSNGSETLEKISMSILKMSLTFWLLGRIMRKYDVPGILTTITSSFELFEKISMMDIKYKVANKNIETFGEFLSALNSSFVNFSSISAILKKYKPADIKSTIGNMDLILNKSFDLFEKFGKVNINPKVAVKSISSLHIFFESIPDLFLKISTISDYIKVNKIDSKAKTIEKIMTPVMSLINMMMFTNIPKITDILKLKFAFSSIFKSINTIIIGLNSVDDKKLKLATKQIKVVNSLFDSMFILFDRIVINNPIIMKAKKGADFMANIGKSIFSMALKFTLIAPIAPIALAGIFFISTAIKILKEISKGAAKLMKLSLILVGLGPALMVFSLSLFAASMLLSKIDWISIAAGFSIMFIATKIFDSVGKSSAKIALGSLALILMSISLLLFSVALLTYSSIFKMVDIGTVLMGSVSILAYAVVFGLAGKFVTNIALGSLAVIAMGIALTLFSIGLLVYSAAVKVSDVGTLLMGSVVLLAYGLVFTLIGVGVTALAGAPLLGPVMAILMGIGLIAFGMGLTVFGLALKTNDIGTLLLGAAVLIAYSIAFAIATIGIIGAPSVILMGIGLLLFAPGLLALSGVMAVSDIGQLLLGAVVIIGMGVAFGIVGLLSPFIIAGSIATIMMGISLPIFTLGLAAISLLPELDIMNILKIGLAMVAFGIGYSIIGVLSPFIILGSVAITGMSLSLPLFIASLSSLKMLNDVEWGSIGKLALLMAGLGVGYAALGVVSPFIFGGILAVTGMSLSLKALTHSLKDALTLDWDKFPIDSISNVLLKLTTAFALVGSDGKTGFGGFITGIMNAVGIGPNNVKRGIDSVLNAGKALTSISEGLLEFDSKMKSINMEIDEKGIAKPGSFLDKMKLSIMAVSEAFGAMGVKYPSKSFFGLWTLDKSAIQKGIEATFESGRALTSVAEGLLQFDEKTKGLFGNDGGASLLNSISKTIGMISTAFSGIATDEVSIFGITLKKSNIQKGIDSVKDIGKTFTEIANGLKMWDDLSKQNIDVDKISKSVTDVIVLISKAFGDIGAKSDKGFLGTGLFTSTDVEKGISSVNGVGKVFGEIAEGLKSFASLEKMGFKSDSFNPNTKGSIAYNMIEVIKATSNVFGEIGKKGDYIESTDSFGNKKKVWVYDESIKKGIDSVKGVGEILSGIANGLKTFSSIDDMKMPSIKKNITDILSLIATVFGEIGSGKVTMAKAEDISAGVKAISGVGKELETISKSLQPYMDIQKNKNLNVDVLKKNIKDIVSTTLIMLGSIGLIQNNNETDKAFLTEQFGNNYWAMRKDNIKAGAETLKAGMDGMDFIQKAADVLKSSTEDSKKLNFDNAANYIKNIIKTALSPFGALGLAQTNDKANIEIADSFFGKNSWLLNNYWIEKGVSVLSNIKEAISSIGLLSEALNKKEFNVTDWETKKQVIAEIIKSPIEAIGTIIKQYGYDNIYKWLTGIMPVMKNNINDLLKVVDTNYNGTIGSMTKDLKLFIKDVVTAKIDKKNLDSMDKIVQFFERWSKIDDPFAKFAKTFKQHLGDFKEYVSQINSIDVARMNSFSDLNYKITELVKLDPTLVATNTASIKDLISKVTESTKTSSPTTNMTNIQQAANDNKELVDSIRELMTMIKEQNTKNENKKLDNSLNDGVSGLRQDIQNLGSILTGGKAQVRIKDGGRK